MSIEFTRAQEDVFHYLGDFLQVRPSELTDIIEEDGALLLQNILNENVLLFKSDWDIVEVAGKSDLENTLKCASDSVQLTGELLGPNRNRFELLKKDDKLLDIYFEKKEIIRQDVGDPDRVRMQIVLSGGVPLQWE